jgi:hypothetical protein
MPFYHTVYIISNGNYYLKEIRQSIDRLIPEFASIFFDMITLTHVLCYLEYSFTLVHNTQLFR